MAQDHPGPMRLGCRPQEGQLPPGPVSSPARPARGKKAIGAVAASILTAAYHMLKNGTLYQDLGPDHFDKRAQGKQVHRLIDRLRNLGFAVQITPVEAAA